MLQTSSPNRSSHNLTPNRIKYDEVDYGNSGGKPNKKSSRPGPREGFAVDAERSEEAWPVCKSEEVIVS